MISRIASLFIGVVLVASACTSSAGSTAEPSATSEPTVVPRSAPDPTPTLEPAPTPTTAPEPTSTIDPPTEDETAVRDVHTRFMTELFDRDERETGPQAHLAEAELITTGTVLARIEERVARDLDTGERSSGPGYLSNIVTVEINGNVADVSDCSQGRGERYDAGGGLIVGPDDFFKIRSTRLVKVEGSWLVTEFFTGGEERCEPPGDA